MVRTTFALAALLPLICQEILYGHTDWALHTDYFGDTLTDCGKKGYEGVFLSQCQEMLYRQAQLDTDDKNLTHRLQIDFDTKRCIVCENCTWLCVKIVPGGFTL